MMIFKKKKNVSRFEQQTTTTTNKMNAIHVTKDSSVLWFLFCFVFIFHTLFLNPNIMHANWAYFKCFYALNFIRLAMWKPEIDEEKMEERAREREKIYKKCHTHILTQIQNNEQQWTYFFNGFW